MDSQLHTGFMAKAYVSTEKRYTVTVKEGS
jgi:hypothetical protein